MASWDEARDIAEQEGHFVGSNQYWGRVLSLFKARDNDVILEPEDGYEFLASNPHIPRPIVSVGPQPEHFILSGKMRIEVV